MLENINWYYAFAVTVTTFTILLPYLNTLKRKRKLRKKYTRKEKYDYYIKRSRNERLTYSQREFAYKKANQLKGGE